MSIINTNDIVVVGSCDNGYVDSDFFASVIDLFTKPDYPVNIFGNIRSAGTLIHKNRENVVRHWLKSTQADWLLFIDSDILFEPRDVLFLCDAANSSDKRIVSGLYFGLGEINNPKPFPVAFEKYDDKYLPIQNISKNTVFRVDATGLGFMLIHRSVLQEIIKKYGLSEIFVSSEYGEDIEFCRKVAEMGIDIYLDTRVQIKHIKRFPLDADFHDMYIKHIKDKSKENNNYIE
jgi:GT2 family glycosyltransferase